MKSIESKDDLINGMTVELHCTRYNSMMDSIKYFHTFTLPLSSPPTPQSVN